MPKSRPPPVSTEPAPAGSQPGGRLRRPSGARWSSWFVPDGLQRLAQGDIRIPRHEPMGAAVNQLALTLEPSQRPHIAADAFAVDIVHQSLIEAGRI